MKKHWTRMLLRVVLFLTIAVAGLAQVVHQLWNWLMPSLFRLTAITFWQALGLLTLSWILFGGLRGFRGPGSGQRGVWRRRTLERWEQMTPEERDKFRKGMRGRCGQFSPDAQPQG